MATTMQMIVAMKVALASIPEIRVIHKHIGLIWALWVKTSEKPYRESLIDCAAHVQIMQQDKSLVEKLFKSHLRALCRHLHTLRRNHDPSPKDR